MESRHMGLFTEVIGLEILIPLMIGTGRDIGHLKKSPNHSTGRPGHTGKGERKA